MSINLTMIAQSLAFAIFVLFCMRYVWPPLTGAMRARQKSISDGLENAARAEQQLQEASESVATELEAAKQEASALVSQAHTRANQIIDEAKPKPRSRRTASFKVLKMRLTKRLIRPEKRSESG